MKIFDLNDSNVYPFEEREKNVFFQSGTFKARLIQFAAGGEIPPCAMAMNVIFCVLQGEGVITVNENSNQVKTHSLIITSPATISMKSDEGMRVLGIQIVGGGTRKKIKVGMIVILCESTPDSFVETIESFGGRS